MAKSESDPLAGAVIDHRVEITLQEVSVYCAAGEDTIRALVDEGVLAPRGGRQRTEWRFDGPTLRRAAKAVRLQRDLDLSAHAVALVLDLLDELDALRAQIGRPGAGR